MRLLLTYLLLALLSVANAFGQAVLVKPQSSARFVLPENPDKQIDAWLANLLVLMREAGVEPVVENESFLTSNPARSTILLFHAECLSNEQIKALQEHVDQGSNLWITGATGYRNETGAIRGWSFLQSLLGGDFNRVDNLEGTPVSLHLKYGKPGTSAIPPGYRWRLALTEAQILATPASESDIVGYWAKEKYFEEPADSIPRHTGFIAKTTLSGGRIVWIGAGLEGVHLDPVNREMTLKIFSELAGWLDGKGIPSVEAWPDDNKCAVLIHGDIEDKFDAVGRLTEVFKRQNVPVTYNILTTEAARFPKAIDKILETKAELSVHGDNHVLFSEQPLSIQIERLKNSAGFISLYGVPPVSFRPPELAYDETTLRALKTAGFTNFLAYNKPDRDYPVYIVREPSEEAGIVFFPKSELDDYDLAIKIPAKSVDQKSHNFIGDFKRIYDLHGLYKLNFHSQYLTSEELPVAVENTIVEIISHDGIWFAPAKEIADWVRLRSRLLIQTASTNSSITLTLINTTTSPARDVVLRILPPQNVPAELLVPKEVSESCQYDVKDGALFVSLPTLKPGAIFKMELSAGSGRALSVGNKKILINGAKAFAAIAAIVILWFIMYLAFSGKKIKRGNPSPKLSPLSASEEELYRKLGFNLQPVDLKANQSENSSDIKPSGISSESSFQADIPKSKTVESASTQFKVTNGSVRNGNLGIPPFASILTASTEYKKPGEPSPNGGIRYERSTKIPSLPMVLKPLTLVERKSELTSGRRERTVTNGKSVDTPTVQIPVDNRRREPVSNAVPLSRPVPEPAKPQTKSMPALPRQTTPIVAKGIPPMPMMKPATLPGSRTFNSPSGLRTTAVLPKTASNSQSKPTTDFQRLESPNNPEMPVPKGTARTSIEILRPKNAHSTGNEEWR